MLALTPMSTSTSSLMSQSLSGGLKGCCEHLMLAKSQHCAGSWPVSSLAQHVAARHMTVNEHPAGLHVRAIDPDSIAVDSGFTAAKGGAPDLPAVSISHELQCKALSFQGSFLKQ